MGEKELDSIVFFEIYNKNIHLDNLKNFHGWLDSLIKEWMINEGNEEYEKVDFGQWNVENHFYGNFNDRLYNDVKLGRYDGAVNVWYRKRGIKLAHHYSKESLEMINWIAGCFEKFLYDNKIKYSRYNFYRGYGMVELIKSDNSQ